MFCCPHWMEGNVRAAAGWTAPAIRQCFPHTLGWPSRCSQPANETNLTSHPVGNGGATEDCTWWLRGHYLQHQLLYSASTMNPQQREEQFEMADAF